MNEVLTTGPPGKSQEKILDGSMRAPRAQALADSGEGRTQGGSDLP